MNPDIAAEIEIGVDFIAKKAIEHLENSEQFKEDCTFSDHMRKYYYLYHEKANADLVKICDLQEQLKRTTLRNQEKIVTQILDIIKFHKKQ